MDIIIVGCGRVGYTLAKKLVNERNVRLVIIDNDQAVLEKAGEGIDAMLLNGDGLNASTLIEAGVRSADMLISVTETDEANILCCITAKHLGAAHTVARVRNPDYALDENMFWHTMGLDMIINPERETALEISRLLRFPSGDDIDVFVGGKVELVSFTISGQDEVLLKKSVAQVFHKKGMDILLALIERGDEAIIPHGDFIFEEGDIIRVMGSPPDIMNFFIAIGKDTESIKETSIVGGGMITHYLAELLQNHASDTNIRIIEIDKDICEKLSVNFPKCVVICGDGTDEDLLTSEYISKTSAVVALTNSDEQNTIIALYCKQSGVRKNVLKINHINLNMVKKLGLGSVVSPRNVTSDQILRYIRGLSKASGDIRTIHRILENDNNVVEAVEIQINAKSRILDKPLKDIRIKKGILIGCIIRASTVIIPTGDSKMKLGDVVILITKKDGVRRLEDIIGV